MTILYELYYLQINRAQMALKCFLVYPIMAKFGGNILLIQNTGAPGGALVFFDKGEAEAAVLPPADFFGGFGGSDFPTSEHWVCAQPPDPKG